MPVKQHSPVVSWETLNLSKNQLASIKTLDMKWEKICAELRSQIIQDKKKLKIMLSYPFIPDNVIKEQQNRILENQKKLRYKAMENFLQKRSILTILQRKRLHEMLSKQ